MMFSESGIQPDIVIKNGLVTVTLQNVASMLDNNKWLIQYAKFPNCGKVL